jgi:hypothetical protein
MARKERSPPVSDFVLYPQSFSLMLDIYILESTARETEKKSFCLTLFMARHVLLTKSKISLHHRRCCVLIFMPQKSPRKNKCKKNTNKAIENSMKNYGFLETTENDLN